MCVTRQRSACLPCTVSRRGVRGEDGARPQRTTSPHAGPCCLRAGSAPGNSHTVRGRDYQASSCQPQFTSPPGTRQWSARARRGGGRSRWISVPLGPHPGAPPSPRPRLPGARGEQTAAAPEPSQELRSTPTQERETVATAGVGPRHRGGVEERAHASLSPQGSRGKAPRL